MLGRLAELDDTFAAAHAEKSLRVAEGVAQLHRLIGQLEARCLPQVSALLPQKLSRSAAYGVLNSLFSPLFLLGCWEHPKQVCGNWLLHVPVPPAARMALADLSVALHLFLSFLFPAGVK